MYLCVRGIQFDSLSNFYFGTVPTAWYFFPILIARPLAAFTAYCKLLFTKFHFNFDRQQIEVFHVIICTGHSFILRIIQRVRRCQKILGDSRIHCWLCEVKSAVF
jgi:hypothetical protein